MGSSGVGRNARKIKSNSLPRSLLRYPGGKTINRPVIIKRILAHFDDRGDREYREPFLGGGSVAMAVLTDPRVHRAWLNDFDVGLMALWSSVQTRPEELCAAIRSFVPSVQEFHRLKSLFLQASREQLLSTDIVELGTAKLGLHRISFSGLGAMSGGPLGGRNGGAKICSRWNPDELCRRMWRLHHLMSAKDVRVSSVDFAEVVAVPGRCAIFADPPYYAMGNGLYQHGFTDADHIRLAESLKRSVQPWLLSYDDHQRIHDLYRFATIEEIHTRYSLTGSSMRQELLIAPSCVSATSGLRERDGVIATITL